MDIKKEMDETSSDTDVFGMKPTPPPSTSSPANPRKTTPNTRVVLSLEERVEVILQRQKGLSERKLAQMFHCGKTQISTILKNETEIMNDFHDYKNLGLKRKRKEKFTEINDKVLKWVNCAKEEGMPITGTILKEKALEFAKAMGTEDFHASNGWLDSFRTRNCLSFRPSTVPSSAETTHMVIEPDIVSDEWSNLVSAITDSYSERDMFSMSETALYFKTLPSKSMFSNPDGYSNDKIPPKEWITVALCASATGEKRPPLIISKSKSSTSLCPNVMFNSTACMTSCVFSDWLENFNQEMVKENRKICLIVNDIFCHLDHPSMSNVELFVLQHNESYKCQPLKEGIIRSFKTEYRKRFLRYIVARMTEYTSAVELAESVTVDDSVVWITAAWDEIQTNSLVSCFNSCGLAKSTLPSSCYGITTEIAENVVKMLSQLAHIEFDVEAANADDLVECYSSDVVDHYPLDPKEFCLYGLFPNSSGSNSSKSNKMSAQQILMEVDKLSKLLDIENCEGGQNIKLHFQGLIDNLEMSVLKKKYINLK